MDIRHGLTAVGAGLTTGVVVAILVIELLGVELSALVGLPVGLLAGLTVLAAVSVADDSLSVTERRVLSAYAAFGLTVVTIAALSYVNLVTGIPGGMVAGAGLAGTVLTYLGLWGVDRGKRTRRTERRG
jgi:hypothetical protein